MGVVAPRPVIGLFATPRPHHKTSWVSSAGGVDRDEFRILSTGFPSSLQQPVNERASHDPGRGLPLLPEADPPPSRSLSSRWDRLLERLARPLGRYPSASLMDVPGNAHYNALSLGYAYINNFLEGLKVSMIMHPSTQSFLFPSPPILASSASCRVVCTLFRATPLPIPPNPRNERKRAAALAAKHIQILL